MVLLGSQNDDTTLADDPCMLACTGNGEVSDRPPKWRHLGGSLKFGAKSEPELTHLSDDDLVAYMVKARDTGHDDELRTATGLLVWSRHPQQLGLVRQKVRNEQDAEDITQIVMEQALKARFDGKHAGQFFSMLNVIRKRRVADYFERQRREPDSAGPLPDGSDPLTGISDGDDFAAGVDLEMVSEAVLGEFSVRDRMVIRHRVDGHPAKKVAEMVAASGVEGSDGLTSINCDTIYSRFRKRLRAVLESEKRSQG